MWWRKRTMQDVEKDLVIATSKLEMFQKIFLAQVAFSDKNRLDMMELKSRVAVLQYELNKLKFKEVIEDGYKKTTAT